MGEGAFRALADGGDFTAQRPNISGNLDNGPKTAQQWFNTAVFSLQALYIFGNASRNTVIGPPLMQFDFFRQKEVPLRESIKLNLRAETYNFSNHVNFNIPNRTAFTANFGSISSAQDARQFQLALNWSFKDELRLASHTITIPNAG